MKAIRFHQTGGPEVLVYEDVPDPTPRRGEVLIRVEAVGMNFADIMRRRGDPYPDPSPTPFILGVEVAGTIVGLGEGVTEPALGTEVFATPGAGGYAQYICVPAASAVQLPAGITAVQAAAMVSHGLSAAVALRQSARFTQGDSILVEGAAGGLGLLTIQLAKLFGAGKIVAAASTSEKRALAERMGADASVDYTKPGWSEKVLELTNGRGVDIVFEIAGGDTTHEALRAMAPFGRMVFIGAASGQAPKIEGWDLSIPNHTVTGFYIGTFMMFPGLIKSTLQEIIELITSGKLKLEIGKTLPLSKAGEAHRMFENRQTTGKVVLLPWDESI